MDRFAPADGVVRVNADACRDDLRPPAREVHGAPRLREVGAHPHHDEADHAGRRRPCQDRIRPLGEVARVEVAVGVGESEHDGKA